MKIKLFLQRFFLATGVLFTVRFLLAAAYGDTFEPMYVFTSALGFAIVWTFFPEAEKKKEPVEQQVQGD